MSAPRAAVLSAGQVWQATIAVADGARLVTILDVFPGTPLTDARVKLRQTDNRIRADVVVTQLERTFRAWISRNKAAEVVP